MKTLAGNSSQPWFVVSKEGLRKTLERKGKAFAIFELLQNAFDEDSARASLTLTEPKNGKSTLICVDDAPLGYADLSNAHTMFAESKKKGDHKKRGRFNVGEKYVLALCDKATITSTTGRVIFHENGTRTHDNVKTKVGSEFRGELSLTEEEFSDLDAQVKRVIPPITTYFNNVEIPSRKPLHEFTTKLPTEIADENGISRRHLRQATIRLYTPLADEQSTLYELGMPVVEVEGKWHIDVQQKVPLNIERDNVTPGYLRLLQVAILNEMKGYLTPEDAASAWVSAALESSKVKPEVVKTIIDKRFGEGAVLYDPSDAGSGRECTARGITVIPKSTFNARQRKNIVEVVQKSSDIHPTNTNYDTEKKLIPAEKLIYAQSTFKTFILDVAPLMLDRKVEVKFIDDPDIPILGCTRWMNASEYIFTVNVAHHDVEDWQANFDLVIHELSHHAVQRNDHLFEGFWRTASEMGAKLAELALSHPHLFPSQAMEAAEGLAETAA